MGNRDGTTRISSPRIPMPASRARVTGAKRNSRTRVMCCSTIATGGGERLHHTRPGTAEREGAQLLLHASAPPGSTVGGDKNFDVRAFVAAVRARLRSLRMWHRKR